MVMNMFFQKDRTELTRMVTVSDPEEYERCDDYAEGYYDEEEEWVDGECLESTTCIRPTNIRQEEDDYDAYVISGVEVDPNTVILVGVHGKGLIHLVSDNLDFKADPDYLGDTYSGMSFDIHDAVFETVYEVEEEGKPVKYRKKTKDWKDLGEPGVWRSEHIPHEFFGIEAG